MNKGLKFSLIAGLSVCCFFLGGFLQEETETISFTKEMVAAAEKLIGLEFTAVERDSMLEGLEEQLNNYENIRQIHLENAVPPALLFNPIPAGATFDSLKKPFKMSPVKGVRLPENREDLAFYSVRELAELIKTRQVTSEQLTRMYLDRLRKYHPKLECLITLTEDLALQKAKRADAEIAAGKYRGPLHGIPYGAKDLLATRGYQTTWGAAPYKDQMIDKDAAVITRLEEAGAVLVAKLTMGALAWGDVWYGGKTRNPWNLEQGSSGSSAGSASATSAGLVAFAIGTETWGSIVSPSTRCGVTGLRPSYGRVSRSGAMALSWSMDKIGPICRTVEDCAVVFNAIYGPDGVDQTLYDLPFNYDPDIDISKLRIGYLKDAFEKDTTNQPFNDKALETLRTLGIELIPLELPELPAYDISFILSAESAAAFDDLTRSNRDDLLVRQIKNAWPNVFRQSRFIPAVEYINANRIRYLMIQKMAKMMSEVDLYVTPSFGENLLLTNLTGHPCVVVPNGFREDGTPVSISFIGKLFGEAEILVLAKTYQDVTGFHLKHPAL
jgi:Asp-tRNA(Asn)/Glu-tRNA(Gln) amidotransferase A subunit family amidase